MSAARDTAAGGGRLLIDVGPIVVFVVAYNVANRMTDGGGIYWGTGAYMAAAVAAMGYSWFTQKRIPPMLLVITPLVLVFGGLTIFLQSPIFAYIKPTIINGLFALGIVGSLLVGRNAIKMAFDSAFTLPDRIWRILAWRWAGWFVFLAVLNEAVWRNFSEPFWANFKVFGVLPLTFLFAMANVPMIMNHQREEGDDPAEADEPPTGSPS